MCIIAYKPQNEEVIDIETLQRCWNKNSDGAGIAVWNYETGVWDVKKGFMKWNDFKTFYKSQAFDKNSVYIVHFRIGTSGNKDGGNTHPFTVSEDKDELRKTEFSTDRLVVHNGVIGTGLGIYSDTVVHVATIVAPFLKYFEQDTDKLRIHLEVLMDSDNNRWIISHAGKDHKGKEIIQLKMLGKWIKEDGIFWSNAGFRAPVVYNHNHYQNQYNDYSRGPYKSINEKNKESAAGQVKESINAAREKNGIVKDSEKRKIVNNCGDIDAATVFRIGVADLSLAFVDSNGNVTWEDDESAKMEYVTCPSCGEDKYLMESTFDAGDTECVSCGAVFFEHTGEIVAYNAENTKASEENSGTANSEK